MQQSPDDRLNKSN